jgi:hypothetical protein
MLLWRMERSSELDFVGGCDDHSIDNEWNERQKNIMQTKCNARAWCFVAFGTQCVYLS